MLSATFRQTQGSFYHGYRLTPYQHQVLMHLLTEEKPQYTVIPDWENLFIVTLLYAEMMTAIHKKVVVYSKWYPKDVEDVLRDVPDFYQLYKEVISQLVELRATGLSSVREMQDHYAISMGSGTELDYTVDHPTRRDRYYRRQYTFDFALNLVADASSFPYVHPEYANEQIYPVWVTVRKPSYQTNEQPLEVRKPLSRSAITAQQYFGISRQENPYALYASLARLGPGDKMMYNYDFSIAGDFGYNNHKGKYFVPYNLYLKLPRWFALGGRGAQQIAPNLSYLEYALLTSKTNLSTEEDKRVRDYALETCGDFSLETKESGYVLPEKNDTLYWVRVDPNANPCDFLEVSSEHGQISPEEEEKRRLLLEEEKIKKKLWISYTQPRSKEGFTLPELRLLAQERGISLKGLKNKNEITEAIYYHK